MGKVHNCVYNADHSEEGALTLETGVLDCGEGIVLVDDGMRRETVTLQASISESMRDCSKYYASRMITRR